MGRPTDICARKHGGAPTSREAFDSTPEEIRKEQAQRIYRLIRRRRVTTEEASIRLGIRYTTASARISELLADGFILDSGDRRPTQTGCRARLYVPAERRRKTVRGLRRRIPRFRAGRHSERTAVRRYLCHGCGRSFRPLARGNSRCAWCRRMGAVMQHQKLKARARSFRRSMKDRFVRRWRNHSCESCRWAIRRGFTADLP